MKKLTTLKIVMLMSLAVGSSHLYGRHESPEVDWTSQSVAAEFESIAAENATDEVMGDLAESSPEVIEKIILNEKDLNSTLRSVEHFVHKKLKEIEDLKEQKNIKDTDIARLAVELADAQSMFEKSIAEERANHKHNPRHEQKVKDLLIKAQKGIKNINNKAMGNLDVFSDAVSEYTKRAKKSVGKIKKGSPKANRLAVIEPSEEVVVEPAEEVIVQSGSSGLGSRLQSLRSKLGKKSS